MTWSPPVSVTEVSFSFVYSLQDVYGWLRDSKVGSRVLPSWVHLELSGFSTPNLRPSGPPSRRPQVFLLPILPLPIRLSRVDSRRLPRRFRSRLLTSHVYMLFLMGFGPFFSRVSSSPLLRPRGIPVLIKDRGGRSYFLKVSIS